MGNMRSLLSLTGSTCRSSSKSSLPSSAHGHKSSPVFLKFDVNHNGWISWEELAALFESVGHAATDDEVERMMEEADDDSDGYISLAEFAAINTARDAAVGEEDLRLSFSVFDAGSDGGISPTELSRVLRGLGEAATFAQYRCMIEHVDRDGDDPVSLNEFKLMMAANGWFDNVRA